jgi:hypothetical protein
MLNILVHEVTIWLYGFNDDCGTDDGGNIRYHNNQIAERTVYRVTREYSPIRAVKIKLHTFFK